MTPSLKVCCLLLLLAGCAGPFASRVEPPEVSIAGLGLGRSGLFEQEVRVDLRLRNPNDFALDVDRLIFDLALNERPFAKGRTTEDFELPALGETVVPVTVTVGTTELLERIMEFGAEQRLDYRLTGEAELDNVFLPAVPFTREGSIAVPAPLRAPGPEARAPGWRLAIVPVWPRPASGEPS